MKRSVRVFLTAAILAFEATGAAGSAWADGARSGTGGLPNPEYSLGWFGFYGKGPIYSGVYASPAYDGYFVYDYPVYTGSDVTAIAVDLANSRFYRRRVTGPGIVYYRSEHPHPYRRNPYR